MFDSDVIVGIGFTIAIAVLLYFMGKEPKNPQYKKEINEILSKEEYKVKGRFE